MRRTTIYWGVSLVIFLLLIFAGVRLIQQKKSQQAQIPPAREYGVVVPVGMARNSDVQLTQPFLAEVQSDSDVEIGSKVTARVDSIVPVGSTVSAGQILVRLDAGDLQAKKRSLESKVLEVKSEIKSKAAELSSLEKTHARNAELLGIQAISQDRFDTEAAKIEALRASINALKSSQAALRASIKEVEDTLSYTTIKAPLAGVVSKTYASAGGTVSQGKPLLSLAGGTAKRLLVRVPDDIQPSALRYGDQQCDLQFLNSSYHGLNEYSCALPIELAAGNRIEVQLVIWSGKGMLMPRNGVLAINGKDFVLVAEGGQARAQAVSVLAQGSEGLVVVGLEAGAEYALAKPDILLKLMTGAPLVRAEP
ncbi:MAG: efflux RND transporter periplasmic adaptor subunit [Thiotrichales bacterium]